MKAYKGFDKNLRCKNFRYDVERAIATEIGLKSIAGTVMEPMLEREKWIHAKATNTESWSVAMNTRNKSASTNMGDGSVSINIGDWSTATNMGFLGAAIVGGKESIAIASGFEGKAKGALGCYIVLAEWEDSEYGCRLLDVRCRKVDGEVIKPDVFYVLKNGEFVEVK